MHCYTHAWHYHRLELDISLATRHDWLRWLVWLQGSAPRQCWHRGSVEAEDLHMLSQPSDLAHAIAFIRTL